MTVEKMIAELHKKCSSANGNMGVYYENDITVSGLIENLKDEICSVESVIDSGYIEEDLNMTEKQAKGYIKKLNGFLQRHGQLDS